MGFMYLLVKTIHMSCAMFSIAGFIVRGIWMMNDSDLLNKKIVKVLPHIIDTVFLLSGLCVVFILGSGLFSQSWLQTKIVLLFVYIGLGVVALRKGNPKGLKITAYFSAITVFAYIIGIAVFKNPASWFH